MRMVRRIYRRFKDYVQAVRCRVDGNCLILFCDGGISSQMYQYMWGQYLIEKGYRVKYDLSFYDNNPRDMDGIFDRSYTLDKLCVINDIEKAPKWQIEYYKKHFLNPKNQFPHSNIMSIDEQWEAPKYLGNYYSCEPSEYIAMFRKYIHIKDINEVLDEDNRGIYMRITNCESVGVHIRRGDMINDKTNRWIEPELSYFVNTMSSAEFNKMHFFLFSDEIDWIKERLIPLIDGIVEYTVVENNGSDKGYIDLLLLSSCKHQIASQGSFGVVAFVLNRNPDKILMIPEGSRKMVRERLAGENVVCWDLHGNRLQ